MCDPYKVIYLIFRVTSGDSYSIAALADVLTSKSVEAEMQLTTDAPVFKLNMPRAKFATRFSYSLPDLAFYQVTSGQCRTLTMRATHENSVKTRNLRDTSDVP